MNSGLGISVSVQWFVVVGFASDRNRSTFVLRTYWKMTWQHGLAKCHPILKPNVVILEDLLHKLAFIYRVN